MKTTIDIPDELFKKTKATAALKGQTLREFVTAALEARLEVGNPPKSDPGWRSGFGMVEPKEVETVDRIIAGDLETADPSEWN